MTDNEFRTMMDDVARASRERRRRVQARKLRSLAFRALDKTSVTRPALDVTSMREDDPRLFWAQL